MKNPYTLPSYALPSGFVQSRLIATLVLSRSGVDELLRSIAAKIRVNDYVDDIALSCNNRRNIDRAYTKQRKTIIKSNFVINERKSIPPALTMDDFNCHLKRNEMLVTEERQAAFHTVRRSSESEMSFELCCE